MKLVKIEGKTYYFKDEKGTSLKISGATPKKWFLEAMLAQIGSAWEAKIALEPVQKQMYDFHNGNRYMDVVIFQE